MMFNLLRTVTLLFIFNFLNTLSGQNVARTLQRNIDWKFSETEAFPYSASFVIGSHPFPSGILPAISENFESDKRLNIELSDFQYVPVPNPGELLKSRLASLQGTILPAVWHSIGGNKGYSAYAVCPFKSEGGNLFILKSFSISITEQEAFVFEKALPTGTARSSNQSLLATGKWVRFPVEADGIYKLDADWFRRSGFDPASIDPSKIKIYGHHGGMLPEKVSAFRHEDLPENAILFIGGQDGKFDDGDYVLFYGQSPHKWKFNQASGRYVHETNIYADRTWYFINVEGDPGKRMQTGGDGSGLTPDASYDWYDYMELHEEETENICREGRIYHGEKFDQQLTHNFTHNGFNDLRSNSPFRIVYSAGAVAPAASSLTVRVNGVQTDVMNFGVLVSEYDCYITGGVRNFTVPGSANMQLSFTYNKPTSGAKAWLDFYELHCARTLTSNASFRSFRNIESRNNLRAEFRMNQLSSTGLILDVSDPMNVRIQSYFNQGSESVFRFEPQTLIREFVLSDGNFRVPEAGQHVANQNLRGSAFSRFIIITHPDFMEASERLANFHRTRDNMNVLVVTPQQIYNEFSSASQDISAIRDFLRYMYYRNTNPANNLKYAMLMGDASFDYKDKIKSNTNFVPVYENEPKQGISGDPDYYCSDDFYGFLDSNDGEWLNEQKLEIAVTRMPVRSSGEADAIVSKIENYKSVESLGEWRNFVTMCADDADAGWEKDFVYDFEEWTANLDTMFPNVNIRKVYLDAYPQQNLGGSQRYPEAQEAIRQEFEQGTLIFNYVGHGGEEYLASEKVIDIPMINTMKNKANLPAFFTATCEFSRYDDALRKSAGEYLITQPEGGAVAMFTTTRIVYAGPNALLTRFFWSNCAFVKTGGEWPTLGDLYIKLKNWYGQNSNDRKFTLFADPALTLNYPEHYAMIDSILQDGNIMNDTLKALGKVTFKGHIEDINGQKINDYNGTVYPIVYDKQSVFKTLGNDLPDQQLEFNLFANILYKGRNTVKNGDFSFTFVVPKDINYKYGFGKVSLYAQNGQTDAAGSNSEIVIGGTDENPAQDGEGPEIELYIDDYTFVSGGLTGNNPLLLARIFDENGINTSGTGIGRDIIAIIDKGTPDEKKYVLNAYYSAELNSYTTGEIRYQLEGLADGRHTYTLKVWDVYNNSSETSIEFIVQQRGEFKISNVLNYPNPFTTNTTFHFDHNRSGDDLKVYIHIMTISGKVIKTIERDLFGAGGHVAEVYWNGRDEFEDRPGPGIYIYRITVVASDGSRAEKVEKMVILN